MVVESSASNPSPAFTSVHFRSDSSKKLQLHHRKQLASSGLSNELIDLNFQSLQGDEIIQILGAEAFAKASGHGQQYVTSEIKRIFRRYAAPAAGGWGCSGLDPL